MDDGWGEPLSSQDITGLRVVNKSGVGEGRTDEVLVNEKTLLTLAPMVYMTEWGRYRLGGLPFNGSRK